MHLTNDRDLGIIYLCPAVPKLSCNWEGNPIDMLEHLLYVHEDLLLDSNSFIVDISRDNGKKYIMATDSGLFLVQIMSKVDKMTVHLQLRFLSYDNSNVNLLKYGIEVTCDSVAFTNESVNENYNPVYNTNNGVDVDLKTIGLLTGHQIERILIKINLYKIFQESINCLSIKELKSDEIIEEEEDGIDQVGNNDLSNLFQESEDEVNEDVKEFAYCDKNDGDHLNNEDDSISEQSLQCVNCKCNMIPPIHLCPNNHSVCYACRSSICSICNESITNFRNLYLENYSRTLKHRCRYEPQGCTELHSYSEIRKHELQCAYCIYKCELCIFEGKLVEIGTHFRIAHPSTKIYETMSGIHFRKGSNFIILNSLGVFYCTSSATDIYIIWEVIYCGPKERFFSCEVKISGKKPNQPTKHYFLKRTDNVYKWTVSWDELKNANAKEKYAMLYVLTY